MPPSAALEGSFAAELQRAIEQRGVSAHWLHRTLVSRGATTDPATLLSWRAGRLVPGPEAVPTVALLEEVLGLEAGRLQALVAATGPAAATPQISPGMERALDALGFEGPAGLVESAVSIDLVVGEHGGQCRVTRRSAWVARRDGARSFPVVMVLPTPVPGRPVLSLLTGCSEGPHYTDLAEGVFATAVVLDQPLAEGETAHTAHQIDLPGGLPSDSSYEHQLREQAEEVALTIEFHPSRVPSAVYGYSVVGAGEPETTRRLPVDGTSVRHTLHDFGPGVVGVRWRW